MTNQHMTLPRSNEPTLLMDEITEHWNNFRNADRKPRMTRIEYLDGLETLLLARQSIGAYRHGRHTRLAPRVVVDEMRSHRLPGGLTVREMAGMLDARDGATTEESD